MDRLRVDHIDVAYGKTQIVHQVSFNLAEGAIGCLLGPSGCGKTTVLLAIAGFQRPIHGQIQINDTVVSSQEQFIQPEKRKVGMVFQDFALFPNLSVADNIQFGIRELSAQGQNDRVDELLTLIDMRSLADSFPHQLSGGQQQRVALARAMAPKPSLLLLDEPFSSLDVELREQLARDVRNILKQENVAAILVTHDQNEAFAMADDICVMHNGQIQQQDNAFNLYRHPTNQFVADFIGEGILITGQVTDQNTITSELGEVKDRVPANSSVGAYVDVLIRPDDIAIDANSDLTATITERAFRGAKYLYTLTLASGQILYCLAPSEHPLQIHDQINISLLTDHLVAFESATS